MRFKGFFPALGAAHWVLLLALGFMCFQTFQKQNTGLMATESIWGVLCAGFLLMLQGLVEVSWPLICAWQPCVLCASCLARPAVMQIAPIGPSCHPPPSHLTLTTSSGGLFGRRTSLRLPHEDQTPCCIILHQLSSGLGVAIGAAVHAFSQHAWDGGLFAIPCRQTRQGVELHGARNS